MSNKTKAEWKSTEIKTLELNLDSLNPRIDLPTKASQAEIRAILLATEDVVGLALDLCSSDGVMAGDRLIVAYENGSAVVLEGNRRTCACQLLLNPKLIPAEFKSAFPRLEDPATRLRLSTLKADIAPTRQHAEPVITRRHTKIGIRKWSVEAKTRRLMRFINNGLSIDDLVQLTEMPRATILRALREHKLIQRIKKLPGWSTVERKQILSPETKWNPVLYFFSLKGSRAPFKFNFDKNGELTSELPRKLEDQALEVMFKPFLAPKKGGAKFTTRTPPQEVYAHVAREDGNLKKHMSQPDLPTKGTKGKEGKPKPKVDKFFESLVCSVADDRLQRLTQEISTVNYSKFPIAATFLQRALVESSLIYAIKKAKLTKQLHEEYNSKREFKKEWRDPGLEFLISFAIANHDEIFLTNVKRALAQWQSIAKDWADLIVHGNYISPSESKLVHSASLVRAIIRTILHEETLE